MGPSGCGKTTFLDLLTGRRENDTYKVRIFEHLKYLKQILSCLHCLGKIILLSYIAASPW